MKKEQFEIWAIDYLRGDLTKSQKEEFENFLSKNESFNDEFKELTSSWDFLNLVDTPKPSENMDAKFYTQLYSEKEEVKTSYSKTTGLSALFGWFRPQYVFGLLLLAIGLLGGYLIKGDDNQQMVQSTEVETNSTIREKLVLTLLEQPSANQRLNGVSEAIKFTEVDEKVVNALLKTLNNDPNVNVRLAAIEALTNYVDNPKVRLGLIQAIPNQESPIIQVTLANLMLALEEKKSVEPFKRLLEKSELDTTVKKTIEKTIESII